MRVRDVARHRARVPVDARREVRPVLEQRELVGIAATPRVEAERATRLLEREHLAYRIDGVRPDAVHPIPERAAADREAVGDERDVGGELLPEAIEPLPELADRVGRPQE